MSDRRHALSVIALVIMCALAVGSINGGGGSGSSTPPPTRAPAPPRSDRSETVRPPARPAEPAIAQGRFKITDGGLRLPPTVTVFRDRWRTSGFQVSRSAIVDVLKIEKDPDGDTDLDQVKVRASGRVGWVSRMQFEEIVPVRDGGGGSGSSTPPPTRAPAPPRSDRSETVRPPARPAEPAIAQGRFKITDGGLRLPPTVTVFRDRWRTSGFQVSRSAIVDVLKIEKDPDGDTDLDQVKVRASGRVGWVSRMQFEEIVPVRD